MTRPRTALLVLLSLALLLVPGTAAAQEASPSPSRPACGAPPLYSVSAAPSEIASGATTTVTVVSKPEPCYADQVPQDVTLYARPAGTQADPVVVGTGRTDASGQVAFVLAPTASTEYSDLAAFTPFANGTRVARVLVDAPGRRTTARAARPSASTAAPSPPPARPC